MRKKCEEWTCDLCGSQAASEVGQEPLGWRSVEVADEERLTTQRHICPFCWEALENVVLNVAAVRAAKKGG